MSEATPFDPNGSQTSPPNPETEDKPRHSLNGDSASAQNQQQKPESRQQEPKTTQMRKVGPIPQVPPQGYPQHQGQTSSPQTYANPTHPEQAQAPRQSTPTQQQTQVPPQQVHVPPQAPSPTASSTPQIAQVPPVNQTHQTGRIPETGLVAARAVNLVKSYGSGDTQVIALNRINIEFAKSQFTAIMGPSGSGKSTLMHCMAGLDTVTEGQTYIGDTELSALRDKHLTSLRRDRLGFVFQSFNLVPTLTAKENITLPMEIAGRKVDEAWFQEVTNRLGLTKRLSHRPSELSGGQQQRVAVARALISRPDIIFGDEPTGNLDSNSSAEVLNILRTSVDELQQTVVIVTHDAKAASYADRVVFLADGRLIDELHNPTAQDILNVMAQIEDV